MADATEASRLADELAADVAALLREGLPQEALRAEAAQVMLRALADVIESRDATIAELRTGLAAERERCAAVCDGIGAGYTGAARRLAGHHATHAAGQRDGANECAAAIRGAERKGKRGARTEVTEARRRRRRLRLTDLLGLAAGREE